MADSKNGIEKGMQNPYHAELDQGISSPVDCWELVGSGPSSPLPEAMVDGSALEAAIDAACSSGGSALEAAIGAACSSGGSLHDDYFACPRNLAEHNILPLMADRQSKEEAHSFARSNALVSLDNETDECKEDVRPMHGGSRMHSDDYVLDDEDMHLDDNMCHDDNPYCMFLDDDVTSLEHCKTDDANPVMYSSEMIEHDDILPAGIDMYNIDTAHTDEDNMNHAHAPIIVGEFTPSDPNCYQLSTLADSSTSHGMQDNSMEIHSASTEGGDSPTALGGVSREFSGQVENSLDLHGSVINTHNIRHCKLFTSASWLWTQLCRWQAQLGYANTIWSVAVAAAVMGILVLGRGWQRLQAQNFSLRSQLWAKEKRITQLMFQLMQTKEALAKTRRIPVICVKSSLQIPRG